MDRCRWRSRQIPHPVTDAIDRTYRCRWRRRQIAFRVDGVADSLHSWRQALGPGPTRDPPRYRRPGTGTPPSPTPRPTSRPDIDATVCTSGRGVPLPEHNDARSRKPPPPTEHNHRPTHAGPSAPATAASEPPSATTRTRPGGTASKPSKPTPEELSPGMPICGPWLSRQVAFGADGVADRFWGRATTESARLFLLLSVGTGSRAISGCT
jgi:hypothetical protein